MKILYIINETYTNGIFISLNSQFSLNMDTDHLKKTTLQSSVLDLKGLALTSIIFKSLTDYYNNFTLKFFINMIVKSFYFRLFLLGLTIIFLGLGVGLTTISLCIFIAIEIYYAYYIYSISGGNLKKAQYFFFTLS